MMGLISFATRKIAGREAGAAVDIYQTIAKSERAFKLALDPKVPVDNPETLTQIKEYALKGPPDALCRAANAAYLRLPERIVQNGTRTELANVLFWACGFYIALKLFFSPEKDKLGK